MILKIKSDLFVFFIAFPKCQRRSTEIRKPAQPKQAEEEHQEKEHKEGSTTTITTKTNPKNKP
jgi:hypothetical protein